MSELTKVLRFPADAETETERSEAIERRKFRRVGARGRVRIWVRGEMSARLGRVLDISAGGCLIESRLLGVGNQVRLEFLGDVSSFVMDAVVLRSGGPHASLNPGESRIALRFLRPETGIDDASWFDDEMSRLAVFLPPSRAPLIATGGELELDAKDPGRVPVEEVLGIIESRPGVLFTEVLALADASPAAVRVAVARLIETGAVRARPVPRQNGHVGDRGAAFRRPSHWGLWFGGSFVLVLALFGAGRIGGEKVVVSPAEVRKDANWKPWVEEALERREEAQTGTSSDESRDRLGRLQRREIRDALDRGVGVASF